MPATGYSARGRLVEPLPRIQSLLVGGIDDPQLVLQVRDFARNRLEPDCGFPDVADPPPELTHKVGEDGALFSRHTVIALQCFLEHPGSMSAEVPLGFDVTFIHTAPRRAQQEIGDVPWISSLPLSNLCGCL